jgi:hypothetical protein
VTGVSGGEVLVGVLDHAVVGGVVVGRIVPDPTRETVE